MGDCIPHPDGAMMGTLFCLGHSDPRNSLEVLMSMPLDKGQLVRRTVVGLVGGGLALSLLLPITVIGAPNKPTTKQTTTTTSPTISTSSSPTKQTSTTSSAPTISTAA